MRHRPKQRGFTIIEVLMFLAISGFVFVAAIGQYSAQQKTVNFNQGVRDLQARLSSVINEAASSYAPDLTDYLCTENVSSVAVTSSLGNTSNSNCIFVGKSFGAGLNDSCSATTIDSCSDTVTVPIIGTRTDISGGLVSSYGLAKLSPLSSGTFIDKSVLNNNIGVYKTFIRTPLGDNQQTIAGIAFAFDLNSASHLGNKIDLLALPAASATGNSNKLINAINKISTGSAGTDYVVNPPNGVTFCIKDGSDKLSAISVGVGSSPLDVQVENTTSLDIGCN